ncbi:MAG: FISUMP domain-containing protein [Bacteroidales bacterium]
MARLMSLVFMVVVPGLLLTFQSCKKTDDTDPGIYGSWTDPEDGMVYKTILIGEQYWLAENLNRGEMISGEKDQTDNGIIEKYCYDNNPVFCEKYGGLYQWDEAMQYSTTESSRGICPAGWHIPSDDEWKILEIYLGMTREAAAEVLWRGVNQGTVLQTGGESGFEALKGGTRSINGSFNQIGNSGFFWSSTADGANHAWRRGIGLENQGIYRSVNDRSFGFPVRCVKY